MLRDNINDEEYCSKCGKGLEDRYVVEGPYKDGRIGKVVVAMCCEHVYVLDVLDLRNTKPLS